MPQTSPAGNPQPLAAKAADTTRENPWPLRLLAENIRRYVDRMSEMWVEGQVVEYRPRPGTKMAYFVLRDLQADMSMRVSTFAGVMEAVGPGFEEGARVVARIKPNFWERTGSLDLRAKEIHLQGIGDLLARVEELRRRLAAEGIFDEDRKKPLPFLPRIVGLVCGRNAKAKEDVMVNAAARWPGVRFEVREVAVQGNAAVPQVCGAVEELDAMSGVDVIVVTRGGGAVEDLLPFSDERMVRVVAAARTPVVSAIGHESDAPLLDLVADHRASTPTDAARRVVPDLAQELEGLTRATQSMRSRIATRLAQEEHALELLTSRPVLLQPSAVLEGHFSVLDAHMASLRRAVERTLEREGALLAHASTTLKALSPQATLERGYSLLRTPSGALVRSAEEVKKGDLLEGVLARGRLVAQVVGATKPPAP
ncbi:exodeoxyribonuclease VII large subunit [Schaalia sp. 19OD2882]|uniref:exodeoxyribonuclease VII large subunit n=1 Tax=Schaalia sp. 19OD2882 TaxID=2794089 RepID=UPI001C7474DA|nr:exodeoxyribonuclease VII large subunit [Schaalia sp. 19OD2882]QWW20204.1 exodeoxyribonuclease VII large subunit [Schaalia sp. 19OD2882]